MNFCSEISKKLSNKAKSAEEFLFIINFDCSECLIFSPEEAAKSGIYFDFEGKSNVEKKEVKPVLKSFEFSPVAFSKYLEGFYRCQKALQRGDTYLINLTYQTPLTTDYSLDEIFRYSNAKFKLLFKDKFVVFSPERFVKISPGKIETRPMKGTIDASLPDAGKLLIENKKELFEHNTIVDLLRNDLNIVAKNVCVRDFRYIDKLFTNRGEILQVSSTITGELEEDYQSRLGEIITALLPAGSVTGAPKEKTIEIIKEAENYERGFYTGVFGFFDGKTTDVAVAIRFIENIDGKLYYKSGGGITALSSAKDEYEELLNKIYVPFF